MICLSYQIKKREFLKQFIEDNKILSNKEVSEKLKITKQAISKRKNKIFNKIFKNS